MDKAQRGKIAEAKRVSNPGCYPTGAVALIRPLVSAGLLPADWPVTINAVSGYSGGGKAMIAEFENAQSLNYTKEAYRTYGLSLAHKHVEEMRVHGGLTHPPLFAPSVGRFYRGMLVELPLQLWALPKQPTPRMLHEALAAAYQGARFVTVESLDAAAKRSGLDPEGLNNTNELKLFVFGNEVTGQARLVALLDNLGKGASGAAVQNLNLMLGQDEATGLR
jgi:N-acetyl-gamma-glutamyl-phosphate reductase